MPGFNQRGPMGQGPMTGRRMGRCTDAGASAKSVEDITNEEKEQNQTSDFWGRGFGFRGGRGRGFGRMQGKGRGMSLQNRFRGGF